MAETGASPRQVARICEAEGEGGLDGGTKSQYGVLGARLQKNLQKNLR